MDFQKINQYKSVFDSIAKSIDDGENSVEVWYARELQSVLGYAKWENFAVAINRAIESCNAQNVNVDDHFRELRKMVALGSGSQREIKDFMLTRYACYILLLKTAIQKRKRIAFAQSYFALQTRKIELIEERLQIISRLETREKLRTSEKLLSRNIYQNITKRDG